jgi:tRNA (adenine57-N1/adenine58-N1)-methyltransferase
VERIVLDVPEPWQAVGTMGDALLMGGIMLSFLPTILQVHRLVGALEEDGRFQMMESMETLLRTWHVTERSVRPDHRMVAHSGFLTTAVRCEPRPSARPPADVPENLQEIEADEGTGENDDGSDG